MAFATKDERCASTTHLWCAECPPGDDEGFSAAFLADEDYCTDDLQPKRLDWDSLGHLDIDNGRGAQESSAESSINPDVEPSSSVSSDPASSSSSSAAGDCYVRHVVGRLLEGPCESSSSSSSESCPVPCVTDGIAGDMRLLESPIKDLTLCHDELGHLVSVWLCKELRWHQNIEEPPSSSLESSSSSSSREGVVVEAFLLPQESSSSSSSVCHDGVAVRGRRCEPLDVYRVFMSYDGLGHLKHVTLPELVSLPCGVAMACCLEGTAIPRTILVSGELVFCNFNEPRFGSAEVCTFAEWDGCRWRGTFTVPCCQDHPSSAGASVPDPVWREVGFSFGCAPQDPMQPVTRSPFYFCTYADSAANGVVNMTSVNCCPLFGRVGGVISFASAGCVDVCYLFSILEVPCQLDCESSASIACPGAIIPPSASSNSVASG